MFEKRHCLGLLKSSIRWTSYGIPHVKAEDWGSLGYGYAYATAKDGLCVIAKELITVRGEQSRLFPNADNALASDVFHTAIISPAKVNGAAGEWIDLPFHETDILADPNLVSIQLTE